MLLKSFKATVVAILILLSFVFGVSSAFAYSKWYSGGFGPHPTRAIVHPLSTFNADSKTAFSNAASQWSNVGAGNIVSMGSDTSNTTYPKDNDQNEVTKGERGSNTYLMQTNATSTGLVWNGLWWDNTIFEADIDINTSYPWVNSSQPNTFDVGNAFTHELGHLLGLDHSNVEDATMWPTIPWTGEISKRTLDQDDKDGILDIY